MALLTFDLLSIVATLSISIWYFWPLTMSWLAILRKKRKKYEKETS